MLSHAQLWEAIDKLAARHGLSPSGLSKLAGLDPTAFNKSKRIAADGKRRWPSTESVAKILGATGASLSDFVALMGQGDRTIPLITLSGAAGTGAFDEAGQPKGARWDKLAFPGADEERLYAIEIAGEELSPAYRKGDHLVVSPRASICKGDTVVVKTRAGELLVRRVGRLTAQRVELKHLNGARAAGTLALSQIAFMHRIVWRSP